MLIPIGDDNISGGSRPFFSYGLLLLNIGLFFFEISLDEAGLQSFINQFGAIPSMVASGSQIHTLFTSMFLHGGWSHLIGNMLFLWIFGDNVEAVLGNFKFLLFYILGGLIASITHVWMNLDSTIPSIGASGAISAVLGAYLVMFPRSRIRLIFLIFFVTFYVSAIFFIGFWFVQQFMSVYYEAEMGVQSQGVAWWAHIGGFVFGLIYGIFYRSKAREFRFVHERVDPRPPRYW